MAKYENAAAIVDRLVELGDDLDHACKIAGISVRKYQSVVKKGERAKNKPAPGTEECQVIIQSPMGGEITPEEIRARVGAADRIYVRVDENKAYWVRGEETGSIDL